MSALTKATMLLVLAAVTARLVLGGTYRSFVQGHMQWPLLSAAAVLAAVGLAELWHGRREDQALDDAAADADEACRVAPVAHVHRAPLVGLLLLAPVVVLYAVAPTSLGAAAAERSSVQRVTPAARVAFPPLPDVDPVPIDVVDFVRRARFDPDDSMDGRQMRLVGFVVNRPKGADTVWLARFVVSCCAADALPVHAALDGLEPGRYPDDTWLQVTGTWVPDEDGAEVILRPDTITVLDRAPDEPYETP